MIYECQADGCSTLTMGRFCLEHEAAPVARGAGAWPVVTATPDVDSGVNDLDARVSIARRPEPGHRADPA